MNRRCAERGSEWAVTRKPILLNLRKSRKGWDLIPRKSFDFARFRVETELTKPADLKKVRRPGYPISTCDDSTTSSKEPIDPERQRAS